MNQQQEIAALEAQIASMQTRLLALKTSLSAGSAGTGAGEDRFTTSARQTFDRLGIKTQDATGRPLSAATISASIDGLNISDPVERIRLKRVAERMAAGILV